MDYSELRWKHRQYTHAVKGQIRFPGEFPLVNGAQISLKQVDIILN